MSGRLYGSTTARMQKVERLRRQSRGGTTPRMGEIELRRDTHMDVSGRVESGTETEQQSRATHDYMDVEGRIASGTAIEDAKAERRPSSYRGAEAFSRVKANGQS